MNSRVLHAVTGRLSLRPPQEESLKRLARALEASPDLLGHERDVASILSTLKAEFHTLEDFEREFPSLCFALATGVGKTRLMPGCTLLPSGGASCKACEALRVAVGCWVSWVGTFHVRISEEPTSGSAPSVTTKAPVFLLKVALRTGAERERPSRSAAASSTRGKSFSTSIPRCAAISA